MTKSELLNQITTSQIYEKFYDGKYTTNKNVKSPFSEDKNPSIRFYKNGTFKCHSSGKQGDAFQFVADVNLIDCKTQFSEVLQIISKEFSLNGYAAKSNHFSFETKPFEKIHLDYFTQKNWNVTKKVLEKYNSFALDKFEFWNSKKEEITKIKLFKNVIGFAYQINKTAEIYIPKQEKAKKFFLNKLAPGDVFGLAQLPKKPKRIIICAGKKDCLILNANGFPAITFRSENHFITQNQFDDLKKRTSNIFVCYDNDLPGINAAKNICTKYNLIDVKLPSDINDVADYFFKFDKTDFERILKNSIPVEKVVQAPPPPDPEQVYGSTIFHIAENYLNKHYHFRFNTILLDVEFKSVKSKEWKICNEDTLYIEMQKKGINIQMAKLISILKSDFVKEYNPIISYFKKLPKWDKKTDHIQKLCEFITTPTPIEFSYHLTKWMARSVKTMLVKGYFNKQAFIITDKGNGQNIGKSHFTKWLCPPSLPSNRSFEDSKKDNLIKLATNAFIILDELDGISRKDLNGLKALFAMDEIRVRLPYARREETVQRTASFIGSTNEENFLADPTGSVRWLVFHVSQIDWNYSKKMDVNKLWAQAYAMAFDETFEEKFTKQDVKENEIRNQTYQIRSSEAEMISLLYELPNEKNKHKILFLTSTEILIYIKTNSNLNRLSAVGVGRALKLLGYQRIKKNGIYGYAICPSNKVLGVANDPF